ncbi:hypothetical protein Tco_0286916 [Tanacetum coccineum]
MVSHASSTLNLLRGLNDPEIVYKITPHHAHRDDLPEAYMHASEESSFHCSYGRFEVGESSSIATARQAGHTLAHRVDYGFIDTVDASIHAFEHEVTLRVGARPWRPRLELYRGMSMYYRGRGLKMRTD